MSAPAASPEEVVQNLYTTHQADDASVFFQSDDQARLEAFFTPDTAELLFQDVVGAKGDLGMLDFDPLFYSQDPEATDLQIGKAKEEGGNDAVIVPASFNSAGQRETVEFELVREEAGAWKIYNIIYADGNHLRATLLATEDPEAMADFSGNYQVGERTAMVRLSAGGMLYRVQFADDQEASFYAPEGDENGTEYILSDDQGNPLSRFVFKTGATDGIFISEKDEEKKVTLLK